jgi:Ca2+/Na+ antiporter
MSDWLGHIALNARARTGFGPQVIVWIAVTVVSLALALGFLSAAAFLWLASRYDAVTAGLILGGIFLLLAIIAAVACWIARLRNMERARRELAAQSHASWLDPKFLGVGIEIGRTLGWRRLITLAAVGLFAAGVGKEWFGSGEKKSESRDADVD